MCIRDRGNIWLDPKMTSPYKFYQFWINADDADLPKFYRYFSFKSKEEIEALEQELADDPNKRKAILAEELTTRIHSAEDHKSVVAVSEILFNKKSSQKQLKSLREQDFETIAQEIPSVNVKATVDAEGINIVELLTTHSNICASNGDARRAIKGNAISVNKVKVGDHNATVSSDDLIHNQYLMIENGKKNKYVVKVES